MCLAADRLDENGLQLENIRLMFSSFSLVSSFLLIGSGKFNLQTPHPSENRINLSLVDPKTLRCYKSKCVFACVAGDMMIENELVPKNQPPFCFMRVDRARVLHSQNETYLCPVEE